MMNYTKSILKNNEKKGKKKQLYMHDEYKTRELLTKWLTCHWKKTLET